MRASLWVRAMAVGLAALLTLGSTAAAPRETRIPESAIANAAQLRFFYDSW